MEFLGFGPTLIFLILVIAVVYAVVSRRRREGTPEADPGMGTIRRLYFYIVSFVALMMAATGATLIIQFVLEELFGSQRLTHSNTPLAVGASLLIVGLPLWIVHWIIVQRRVREMPVERRSLLRKAYIYLGMGVSVGFVIAGSIGLLEWAFREDSFSGFAWGAIIVWGAIWAFHWRIEEAEGQATIETRGIRRFYLYLVSLVALAIAAVGFGQAISIILLEGYESLVSTTVLLPGESESGLWRAPMRSSLSLALVGSAVWAGHWLYMARKDYGSVLRQVYLYIFAILGGAISILVALGFIINGVLAWLIGASIDEATQTYFRFLPGSLALLSIGLGLWAYHWTTVQKEAEVSPHEAEGVRRAYAYILSALGMGALVVAIGVLVNTALAVIFEGSRELIAGRGIWRAPIALSITLGILGAPLWGYYWRSIQQRVSTIGAEERESLARRVYIFAALGIGALALLGSGSTLLFFFLRDLLGDGLSFDTLRDAKGAIDIIVAVAIFLPYHWLVYRQDRQAAPEAAAPVERVTRKEVSVLVGEDGNAFVQSLEAALGYRVIALRWADPDATQPQLEEGQFQELAQRVNQSAGYSVLLVPDGTTVRVLSYD